MKNIIIFFLILSITSVVKGNVVLSDTIQSSSLKLAQRDINKGNIKFIIQSGIVSGYKKGQQLFEKKYKIKYSDLGCVIPKNLSIVDYNKTVAIYMDKKYGLGWRVDVRKDVAGI